MKSELKRKVVDLEDTKVRFQAELVAYLNVTGHQASGDGFKAFAFLMLFCGGLISDYIACHWLQVCLSCPYWRIWMFTTKSFSFRAFGRLIESVANVLELRKHQ